MKKVEISTEYIKLDQFLKWINIADSGKEAKFIIKKEIVLVNNEVETRRGKKLRDKDIVTIDDKNFMIVSKN